MTDTEMFSSAVQKIETQHKELGYERPWRFLYTPKATLRTGCDLLVVGLNPADHGQEVTGNPADWASCEWGNAFHPDAINNPAVRVAIASRAYANRLCRIFECLVQALGRPSDSWGQLMHQTPTSNFCPFRASNGLDGLPKQSVPKAREFSRGLWRLLLDHFQPRVILCLGTEPADEFRRLCRQRPTEVEETMHPSAWPKKRGPDNRDFIKAAEDAACRVACHLRPAPS